MELNLKGFTELRLPSESWSPLTRIFCVPRRFAATLLDLLHH